MPIMRDHLLGYLLKALEPGEREAVDRRLAVDSQLQRELAALERRLAPLQADRDWYDPPAGLAQRTCELVARDLEGDTWTTPAQQAAPPALTRAAPLEPAPGRWTLADLMVAAGVFLAASALFFPALSRSQQNAHLAGCQNNLRQVGLGLDKYSQANRQRFPSIATEGNLSAAGIYAVKLLDGRYVDRPQVFVCPGSAAEELPRPFRVPSLDELQRLRDEAQLAILKRRMGGTYGYNLGYLLNGKYTAPQNLGRTHYALVADAPRLSGTKLQSANHGGGQNVLFEDGHVRYLTDCSVEECGDEIYLNEQGLVGPGLHVNDAVIGASAARPVLLPVRLAP
jgi:prepilin-type processing-associated H-X9-DG protein